MTVGRPSSFQGVTGWGTPWPRAKSRGIGGGRIRDQEDGNWLPAEVCLATYLWNIVICGDDSLYKEFGETKWRRGLARGAPHGSTVQGFSESFVYFLTPLLQSPALMYQWTLLCEE